MKSQHELQYQLPHEVATRFVLHALHVQQPWLSVEVSICPGVNVMRAAYHRGYQRLPFAQLGLIESRTVASRSPAIAEVSTALLATNIDEHNGKLAVVQDTFPRGVFTFGSDATSPSLDSRPWNRQCFRCSRCRCFVSEKQPTRNTCSAYTGSPRMRARTHKSHEL